MHIGILSARSPSYHPNQRLMESAAQSGHQITLIHPKDCISGIASGRPDLLRPNAAHGLDVLLPRIGATINPYALTLVRHFEISGTPVVNNFSSIMMARNKFLTLQTLASHGIPVPESQYVSNPGNFKKAVERLGGYPVVAKIVNARQGKGVMIVDSPRTDDFIMENLTDKSQGVLIQEYLSPEGRKDIRALILGKKVVAGMEVVPRPGEFRANIHLKAKGRPIALDRSIRKLAVASAASLGLEVAGMDIIIDGNGSPKVIEANYSPGFRGLEAMLGLDIATEIIRYLEGRHGGRS